jgi:hypothetical protein
LEYLPFRFNVRTVRILTLKVVILKSKSSLRCVVQSEDPMVMNKIYRFESFVKTKSLGESLAERTLHYCSSLALRKDKILCNRTKV